MKSGTLVILVVVALVAGLGAGYLIGNMTAPKVETQEILFALDWVIDGIHSPYFLALDKGYFAEEGLSVSITAGYGSDDTQRRVELGQADFGHAAMEAVMFGRDKGATTKEIGMFYSSYPYAMFSLDEANVASPQALEGKTIALTDVGEQELLKAFCALNDVDYDSITTMIVDYGALASMFFAGETDLYPGYYTDIMAYCEVNDIPIYVLSYNDWGFPMYGNGLITKESTIQNSPELVRKMARAVYKGWQYTIDHRQEAVDAILKYHPELDAEETAIILDIGIEQMFVPSNYAEHGLGWIDETTVQFMLDQFTALGTIETDLQASDIFTNDYLPGLYPP